MCTQRWLLQCTTKRRKARRKIKIHTTTRWMLDSRAESSRIMAFLRWLSKAKSSMTKLTPSASKFLTGTLTKKTPSTNMYPLQRDLSRPLLRSKLPSKAPLTCTQPLWERQGWRNWPPKSEHWCWLELWHWNKLKAILKKSSEIEKASSQSSKFLQFTIRRLSQPFSRRMNSSARKGRWKLSRFRTSTWLLVTTVSET